MKRALSLLFVILLSAVAFAQTQQGYVKTRGKVSPRGASIPGVRLSGATVSIRNGSSFVSANNGTFSFGVPTKTYAVSNVRKNGYELCDRDLLGRNQNYSSNPLIIVMDTRENQLAEKLEAQKRLTATLEEQYSKAMAELKRLKKQQKITEEEYYRRIEELSEQQDKNAKLVAEMAERYASLDFDQMDEFQRKVVAFIQNGQLMRADSLMKTKGSMSDRSDSFDQMDSTLKVEAEDLARRQKAYEKGKKLRDKMLEEFAADCYNYYEIFKLQHQNDSAAYYLEWRASKDTLNAEWQLEAGRFIADYLSDYRTAEAYLQRALDLVKSDEDNTDYYRARYLYALGVLAHLEGDYKSAESYYLATLDAFASDPYQLIAAYSSLSFCYSEGKERDKALRFALNALECYNSNEIDDSDMLFDVYRSLGNTYLDVGQLDEAIHYQEMAMVLAEASDGITVGGKLSSMASLASLYRYANRYTEAEELFVRALDTSLLHYGEDHAFTVSICNNIAVFYDELGKFDDAIAMYERSLAINKRLEHQNTSSNALVYSNLASVYLNKSDLASAEACMQKALEIYTILYNADDPVLISFYLSEVNVLLERGCYDEAQVYAEKALAICRYSSNELNPSLGVCYSLLGGICLRKNDLANAKVYFDKTLELSVQIYGEENQRVADACTNVGGIYLYTGDYEGALSYLLRARDISLAVYGEEHADVASAYNGLAQTYKAMKRYDESIEYFEKAIQIRKKLFGETNPKVLSLYRFLIEIYEETNRPEEAEKFRKCLE